MDHPYHSQTIEGRTATAAVGYLGAAAPVAGVNGVEAAIGFDDITLGKHILFLGGIGSGKTVGMSALVASLRQQANVEDVFIFFDTKGDYLSAFHRPGDVTLTPQLVSPFPATVTWNIFNELRDVAAAELADQVTEICSSLIADESAGATNRIWTAMARDLLAALIVAYSRSGRPYSNADVRAMADQLTVDQMRAIIGPHRDLRGTLQYIAKDTSNTTISVLIFLQQAVREVFSASFRRRGDFSVRQFIREKGGRALFLEYDVAMGTTVAPVFRTLLDIALKESLGRNRPSGRVFVILDEFSLLPPLTHIDAGLNFGRSLGLRFVVGTQNIGQVSQAYGDGLASSILSGFGTVFSFRLFDQTSRDYVRNRFGHNRKVVRYDAAVKTRGLGEQLVDGYVIEDWDLSDLRVGQCIVGLPEGPPYYFTFAPPS